MITGTMMMMQMIELLKTMVEKMENEWHELVGKVDNLMITVNNTTLKVKDMEQDIHNAINDAISNLSNCPSVDNKISKLENLIEEVDGKLIDVEKMADENHHVLSDLIGGLVDLSMDALKTHRDR